MNKLIALGCQVSDIRYKAKTRFCLKKFFAIFMFCFMSFSVSAEDITFNVSVNRTKIALGQVLELNLDFSGVSNISRLDLPQIEGFSSRYVGPASSVSIVNGQTSSSITHMYQLVPLKTGSFTIPSFSVTFRGKTYVSKPISIEVVPATSGVDQSRPSQDSSSTVDLKDRIFLKLEPDKKIAYINEIIQIKIKLYMQAGLSVDDVQYPSLAQEGLLVEPFEGYKRYREVSEGVNYDVIEFNTTGFGLRPGELILGPAKIQCNLLLESSSSRRSAFDRFDSFFGAFDSLFDRRQRYPLEIASNESAVLIKDLPSTGRPAGFNQSLGDYTFEVQASPLKVQAGDPITLRMIVKGRGNFKTVNPPELNFGNNFKVYQPQTKQTEYSKIFEQVIIANSENITQIPAVSFSFFDPAKERYITITSDAIPIEVSKSAKAGQALVEDYFAQSPGREDVLSQRDIVFIKDRLGSLGKRGAFFYNNPLFILIQVLPLVMAAIIIIGVNKARRVKSDIGYARRLRAPVKAKKGISEAASLLSADQAGKFYDCVHRTMSRYFSDTLHLPIGSVSAEVICAGLKSKGVPGEILEKINFIFQQCESARFAPLVYTFAERQDVFEKMREIIDYIERKKI